MALSVFDDNSKIIGALHLPDLSTRRDLTPSHLEEYAVANARAFVDGGIRNLILQDQTRQIGSASPETIATTTAIARLLKMTFAELSLGIIVQAHDARAPLAIAHASGADFVRLKVFVGAAMTFEGAREPLGVDAATYRHFLRAENVAILADVFDRTCVPLIDVSLERAAHAAVRHGADGLVLTGGSFAESLEWIKTVREAGVTKPIVLGGGVDENNVSRALEFADAVIVSTALMHKGSKQDAFLRWDVDRVRALVAASKR